MSTMRTVVDASVGILDVNVTAALGIKMDVQLCAGLFINMHAKGGGEADINFVSGAKSFTSFGVKAQKAAAMDAKVQDLILADAKGQLANRKLDVNKVAASVKSGEINLNTHKLFFHI